MINTTNIYKNTQTNTKTNTTTQQTQTNNYPLRILTHNVRGLNDLTKQQQLIDYMDLNNVAIFGLSETKLLTKTAQITFKKYKDKYTSYFHSDENSTLGTGVGIILSNEYARYVHKMASYKGRVIYVNLITKGRIKIRIIQVYLPTTSTGMREYTTDLYQYITTAIKEAHTTKSRIILMGDFNMNYEKFIKHYNKNGHIHWQNKLFDHLHQLNMHDTIQQYQTITPSTPFHTFTPNHPNQSPSRIDFIWVSTNLLNDIINSNVIDQQLYSSDHKVIYISMFSTNLFKRKSIASRKQHKMGKTIYHYDQMDNDKWQEFADLVDVQHDSLNLQTMSIHNTHGLNYYWCQIQACIKTAASKTIPNHYSTTQHREQNPKHLKEIYSDIKHLNRIIIQYTVKNWEKHDNWNNLSYKWRIIHNQILTLATKYNIDINLPDMMFDISELIRAKKEIMNLKNCMKIQEQCLESKNTTEKIKKFSNLRCENFKDDKGCMIDSCLAREHRKIVIDRSAIIDDLGHETLITDPNDILTQTNNHFQTCPGGVHEPKEIPPQWSERYQPISTINPYIYNYLMTQPSQKEWSDVINQLPLDKAAGPTGITNEMLKHLGPKLHETIRKFIGECLRLNDIPTQWKHANIYPIPKPKDWNCDLNNTRPITLLETLKKALVRVLNTRLANIMIKNNITLCNQFAGLPQTSTFEPIRILNELLQDAKEKNNEIWVLFQDLSKAYDRVNIFMLEKAMIRLRLPTSFISFIKNIFTNRKNSIFTEVGMTTPYDVLIGIDQGEVIFSLLWCIYYDPLLKEIESRNLGYQITHSYQQHLYDTTCTVLSTHNSASAYMDDTTWVTPSKTNLELILEIADDFYKLNNIKVNKTKSELIVNIPNEDIPQEITLSFGNETVVISPAQRNESIRTLGVWINFDNNRSFIKQQALDEVRSMCNIIKRKRLTDKQLLYLFNMVIIPKIEYRTQLCYLSPTECSDIMKPFRKIFKQKLHFASSMPNAILENRLLYNFRDFYEVQLQSKISNFLIQINSNNLLGEITNIRIKQLQTREWLQYSPLFSWPYNKVYKKHYKCFITSMISLCYKNNISFSVNINERNEILGGQITIASILNDFHTSKSFKQQLRNRSIMFLDQLTTPDGIRLNHWYTVATKSFNNNVIPQRNPLWFKSIESIVLTNFDGRRIIKNEYRTTSTHLRGTVVPVIDMSNKKRDFISIYHPSTSTLILGRIVDKIG